MDEAIEIKRARVNNLKDVTLTIPRGRLVAVTGVSGSGKSSLAFDTLYAEGQRRYVESLSSYARQFLGRMSKPECDYIKGLPPAIAIEQKVTARNPRSTVGTSTEIYEYMRMLFARVGRTFSPISGCEVKRHSLDDITACLAQYAPGTKYAVLAPLIVPQGRTVERQLLMELQQGYSRVCLHGRMVRIDDLVADGAPSLTQSDTADLWLLVSRLTVDDAGDALSRLSDAVETAYYEGDGRCRIMVLPGNLCYDFSTRFEADGITFAEPTDNMFAFNSPLGACPECEGFGTVVGIDEKLVIPNTALSVYEGCVQCWHGDKLKIWQQEFCRRAMKDNFPIFEPYHSLSQQHRDWLWHGLPSERHMTSDRVSIDDFFRMVSENMYKIQYRVLMSRYRGKTVCPKCRGTRLKPEAGYVMIGGKNIMDLVDMPIGNLKRWFDDLVLTDREQHIAGRLLVEIKSRLQYLVDVGVDYLTLNRPSNTLSGGESQRISLTTSLGSSLVGSLYILDEPSIGLHSRDTHRLIAVLKSLQAAGNTVVVVEHDEEIMRAADHIIDIGPDAGNHGGEVVYQGNAATITPLTAAQWPRSYTVSYLSHAETIAVPACRRPWNMSIRLRGARMNNLRGIDVTFPLNVLTVVTGVSGSGKSSLVKGTLYPALKRKLDEVADIPGEHLALEGDYRRISRVEFVDQNPIGKSTRSNPVTYVKAYDLIRDLFARQPLAQQMGFTPQHFSFNAEGGRCEECAGAGVIAVEMQFMADIVLECEACHGKRFKRDILDVTFAGKNIDDVLNMTVDQAIDFFAANDQEAIVRRLQPLHSVGLGYICLGQSSSTLSGGENQRVKLALYIGQERQTPTLFIFDEPTTGLHFHDIRRLLATFNTLIGHGHTIVVIEHNMEVIKSADYIIDLGPEGGNRGGSLVACGTPEEVVAHGRGHTARYLRDKLSC